MLLKEFEFLHSALQAEISFNDFTHVRSLFLGHNDKVLKQKSTIQQNKFDNLLKDTKPQHDPEKVILAEKSLFQKDLNFSNPPKKLNHADYLISFELFYRDFCNLQVLSTDDFIAIVDRDKYIEWMENFVSDQSKSQKTALKDDNFLNFIAS